VYDKQQALELAERALKYCTGVDQAMVQVSSGNQAYSRFGQNYVTQNLDQDNTQVSVTVISDTRSGLASGSDHSDAGLRKLAALATEIAKATPKNPEFVSLAKPEPIGAAVRSMYPSTATATGDDRVAKLQPVFSRMATSGLVAAGYTTTQTNVNAVVNSLGVRASWEGTYSGIEIKAMAANTSGFAEYFSRDYASVNSAERANLAAAKATVATDPADFEPGTYTVILEPPAFIDCLNNLYSGMNISNVLEDKDSWMIDRIGKTIFSPNLTIVDDWSNPLIANQPFADDGSPTQKVVLIDKGTPTNYVSNTYLANKYKKPNTGHSGGFGGAYPSNAVVMPGTKSREQLIAETDKGILISRTWYTRAVDPRDCTITGLTRDGVFLIEGGKLTKTLKNFRFFTSVLKMLEVVELGNTQFLAESADTPGTLVCPVAKIGKFTLSAQTSFA
jgi:predicted Zn-dependent protease